MLITPSPPTGGPCKAPLSIVFEEAQLWGAGVVLRKCLGCFIPLKAQNMCFSYCSCPYLTQQLSCAQPVALSKILLARTSEATHGRAQLSLHSQTLSVDLMARSRRHAPACSQVET
jgi:hypothetical protein